MITKIQIILTEDGSHTLIHLELDESYHSVHGAIQESEHIFIQTGFREAARNNKAISLLEVGLGTGLNALLTLNEIIDTDTDIDVHYTALEPFPISENLAADLNYPQLISNAALESEFRLMHHVKKSVQLKLNPRFMLEKHRMRLQDFEGEPNSFNLIYYDAFSPEKAPEMWEAAIFNQLYQLMQPGGILVTYCARGAVRRAMQHAGFVVERLAGPPGKREILRAIK